MVPSKRHMGGARCRRTMESSYTGLPLRMGKFSFEGQMPKADCTENCARELLNTLLWCEQTRCFDAARLPASSTADLRAFYQPGGPAEQQHDAAARPMYPPSYPDVWYQMCSNHRGVQYLAGEGGRRYEAVPSIDNVCALLGVLMGLGCTGPGELCECIRTGALGAEPAHGRSRPALR